MNSLNLIYAASKVATDIISAWSTLPIPTVLIDFYTGPEAVDTKLAFEGWPFHEVDLCSPPFIDGYVCYGNLTADAAFYYAGSYFLFGLTIIQGAGKSADMNTSIVIGMLMQSDSLFGREKVTFHDIITRDHPEFLEVTRRAIELFCVTPENYISFTGCSFSKIREIWNLADEPTLSIGLPK
jgi:hypothetical protein